MKGVYKRGVILRVDKMVEDNSWFVFRRVKTMGYSFFLYRAFQWAVLIPEF